MSSSSITTPKNPTSLIFYLHFSSFTYKLFSTNFLTTFSTTSLCSFSSLVSTMILSIKLATSPVLIQSLKILFIIVYNIASEFVSPKNIIVGLNNPSRVMNTAFYLFPSFIHILLYPHYRSNFVNTFLYLYFLLCLKSKVMDNCF